MRISSSRRMSQWLLFGESAWSNWTAPASWERRSNDRVGVTLAVKQRVRDQVSLCQAGNLSSTGVFLARADDALYQELPKCWLEFGLPGRTASIAARGQVVRQVCRGRYHLMGIHFTSMPPSHRRLLYDYLGGAPSEKSGGA